MSDVLSQGEIDQLLDAINANEVERDEDEEQSTPKESKIIKIYNPRRPNKFSNKNLITLSSIFETFCKLSSSMLSRQTRMMTRVYVASSDQLTYEEFIRSIPTPTSLAIINPDPLKVNWVMEMDPAITFSIIDRKLGGNGEGDKYQHELTDIEASIMEEIFVRLLGIMRESFTDYVDLRPRLGQIETNPQYCNVVPSNEMVALMTLEVKLGDVEGMMNVCIPFSSVNVLIEKFVPEFMQERLRKLPKLVVREADVDSIAVKLKAELFRQRMLIGALRSIRKNDVLLPAKDARMLNLVTRGCSIGEFEFTDDRSQLIKITSVKMTKEKSIMEEKMNLDYIENGGLDDVKVQVSVELGRTCLTIGEIRNLTSGASLQLDKLAGEPIDVFANNVRIGKGEIVTIEDSFGIRMLETFLEETKEE